MKQQNIKLRKAALILFGAAFVLLVANLAVSSLLKKEPIVSGKVLQNIEIDSLFTLSLRNLGLTDISIIKRTATKIPHSYKIKVPSDLSIPVVLSEINLVFSGSEITIAADEKSPNGLTVLEISSEEKLVLTASLNYDTDIIRDKGSIAFVIEGYELSEKEDSLLMDIAEPFTLLFTPNSENIETINFIKSKNKSYSVLLNDDISELKYKLDESYSNSRIKGPIHSILNDFSGASIIFIDDKSDIYKSLALKFLEEEFSKRNIKLNNLSKLLTIDYRDEEQLINEFDKIMKSVSKQESAVIRISRDEFNILQTEIKKYKKLGYKVVHPSELIYNR